jgi:hypothetical protein
MSTALKTTTPRLTVVPRIDPLLDEASGILSLMGWSDIPTSLKRAVALDVIGYRDELLGLYATADPNVMARRRSVYWWVEAYRTGACALEEALAALRITID